jgi:type I restriction enzyme S subunit
MSKGRRHAGWSEGTLGDVVTLKRGYDLPAARRRPGSVPVVSSAGITGWHDEVRVAGPGVVTGRYGTLGEVYFVEGPFWPLNTTLFVEDFKGNDPRFVSYLLREQGFGGRSGAAAVPGINRNILHKIPVNVPPLCDQLKIAFVLGAYDELIENTIRRIRILEEMARAIYREWIVEYRYPGHEGVPLVDSDLGPIPKGWEASVLGAVIELAYGKALKADQRIAGKVPVFGSSGVVGWHNVPLVDGPGVVVGRKGNVGSVYLSDVPFYPIDTTYYVRTKLPMLFIYFALSGMEFIDSHAAVPGLSRDQANRLPLIVPDSSILDSFIAVIDPLVSLARTLQLMNVNLRSTRDLFLPRLVSGEIDVSGLQVPEVA